MAKERTVWNSETRQKLASELASLGYEYSLVNEVVEESASKGLTYDEAKSLAKSARSKMEDTRAKLIEEARKNIQSFLDDEANLAKVGATSQTTNRQSKPPGGPLFGKAATTATNNLQQQGFGSPATGSPVPSGDLPGVELDFGGQQKKQKAKQEPPVVGELDKGNAGGGFLGFIKGLFSSASGSLEHHGQIRAGAAQLEVSKAQRELESAKYSRDQGPLELKVSLEKLTNATDKLQAAQDKLAEETAELLRLQTTGESGVVEQQKAMDEAAKALAKIQTTVETRQLNYDKTKARVDIDQQESPARMQLATRNLEQAQLKAEQEKNQIKIGGLAGLFQSFGLTNVSDSINQQQAVFRGDKGAIGGMLGSIVTGVFEGTKQAYKASYEEDPNKRASGILGGAAQIASGFGPIGMAVGGLLNIGKLIFDFASFQREQSTEMLNRNLRFAEFSGGMATVQAQQEVFDIQFSAERGDRRAGVAGAQARARQVNERRLAEQEDATADMNGMLDALSNDPRFFQGEAGQRLLAQQALIRFLGPEAQAAFRADFLRRAEELEQEDGLSGDAFGQIFGNNNALPNAAQPPWDEAFGRPGRFMQDLAAQIRAAAGG